MHDHGPNCLEGPIRGSHAWWRGLAPPSEPAQDPAPATRNDSSKMEETAIRQELVERIRSQIQAGIYDTPEKWQAALDCLLGSLEED